MDAPSPDLPHNVEAEQALLGAMLIQNRVAPLVASCVRPDQFWLPVHGRIYEKIHEVIDAGGEANPVTLRLAFEDDPALESVGGASYLARLAGAAVTVINARSYAFIIRDLAVLRAATGVLATANTDVHSRNTAPAHLLENLIQDATGLLAECRAGESAPSTLGAAARAAVERLDRVMKAETAQCTMTGLVDVDGLLGGLWPADLCVLAGRPGMGKTALGECIASNAARHGNVVFFSMEMSEEQIANRALSRLSRVPADSIRSGRIEDSQFAEIYSAATRIADVPIHIEDRSGQTIAGMRAALSRQRHANPVLVLVDYIQLLTPSQRSARRNRVDEVTEFTQGLKGLAKEYEVPVLALSQLNRAVENRENKRPQLSDLRESGSIEQDADSVMFLYRAEYYLRNAEPEDPTSMLHHEWEEAMAKCRNTAELIIAKNRHGRTGTAELRFDGPTMTFTNLARSES